MRRSKPRNKREYPFSFIAEDKYSVKGKRRVLFREEDENIRKMLELKGVWPVKGSFRNIVETVFGDTGTKYLFRPIDGTKVRLNALLNKYLVICSVSLPLHYGGVESHHYSSMIEAYSGLISLTGGAFEMVIVADSSNPCCSEADFNAFFSGFPGLTIPFADSRSRAYTADLIYLCIDSIRPRPRPRPEPRPMVGIILDEKHNVLQGDYCGPCFASFGPSFYPFTYHHVRHLIQTECALECRLGLPSSNPDYRCHDVSLSDLLFCKPYYKLQRRSSSGRRHEYEEISVVELSKKQCVGVYLCTAGNFMSELLSIYHQCEAQQLEFEIVLVCLSSQHFETVTRDTPGSSFWLYPYFDYASNTLLRRLCHMREDCLFIVRPDGKSWELMGKHILRSDGIASYPFTREAIREQMTSPLFSLLGDDDSHTLTKLPYKNNNNNNTNTTDSNTNKYTVAHLRHKNVLVYFFHHPKYLEEKLLDILCGFYNNANNNNNSIPDLEVVFAPLCSDEGEDDAAAALVSKSSTKEMPRPWFMLPPEIAQMAAHRLFTKTGSLSLTSIAAFGKDGRVRWRSGCWEDDDYLSHALRIASAFADDDELPVKDAKDVDQLLEEHLSSIHIQFEWDHMYI